MKHYAGIDLSMETSHVCVVDADAQLARTGFYKEVHVKSPAAHGVRSVITARGHLVEARVRLDNTIRGLCATFGIRLGAGQGERDAAQESSPRCRAGFASMSARAMLARQNTGSFAGDSVKSPSVL